MTGIDVLIDGFGRVRDVVREVSDGLSPDALAERPGDHGNSIGWLLWHLTRVQDDHIAEVADSEQVYLGGGFVERFGLPLPDTDIGYGHNDEQVAALKPPSAELLSEYHDAVHDGSVQYLRSLSEADLERVVDDRWDPPVTLSVRLVSVLSDDLQHAGQAAYVRGLLRS